MCLLEWVDCFAVVQFRYPPNGVLSEVNRNDNNEGGTLSTFSVSGPQQFEAKHEQDVELELLLNRKMQRWRSVKHKITENTFYIFSECRQWVPLKPN